MVPGGWSPSRISPTATITPTRSRRAGSSFLSRVHDARVVLAGDLVKEPPVIVLTDDFADQALLDLGLRT